MKGVARQNPLRQRRTQRAVLCAPSVRWDLPDHEAGRQRLHEVPMKGRPQSDRAFESGRADMQRRIVSVFLAAAMVILVAGIDPGRAAGNPLTTPDFTWLAHSPDFVDVSAFENVHTSLRYASEDNFLRKNVYGNFHRCFLRRVAADKFRKAVLLLGRERPGWKFLVFDCLRPRSIQQRFFAVVAGTAQEPYVADPRTGSIHNYGLAIDLSLEDGEGHEIDMGTKFDDFSRRSEPRREQQYLATGQLTREQIENRRVLRSIMQRAGFIQLANEWWHYDALPKEEGRSRYKLVE